MQKEMNRGKNQKRVNLNSTLKWLRNLMIAKLTINKLSLKENKIWEHKFREPKISLWRKKKSVSILTNKFITLECKARSRTQK